MAVLNVLSNAVLGALYPLLRLADTPFWQEAFRTVLNLTVNGSWAVVILLVIRAGLQLFKAPRKYAYALWAVAAFRFACPVSFTVASVFSLLPSAGRDAVPADIGYQAVPQVSTGAPMVDRVINSSLPPATPAASVNPMQLLLYAGSVVWALGLLVLCAAALRSTLRLRRQLKDAAPLPAGQSVPYDAAPSPLRRLAGAAPVYTLPGSGTAFVYGVLRPRIYLPESLAPAARRCVLLHERTHLARADHLIKLLAFCLVCIHWFNPLAWLAFVLAEKDMEQSCDEAVLNRLGDGADYAQSLLDLSARRRLGRFSPVAFGEHDVAARIKRALNYKKPAFWVSALALVLAAVLGFGLAADPEQHPAADPAPPASGQAASEYTGDPEELAAAVAILEEAQPGYAEFYRVVVQAAGADTSTTVLDKNGNPYWPMTGLPGIATTHDIGNFYNEHFSGGADDLTGDDGSGKLYVMIDGQLCRAAVKLPQRAALSTQVTKVVLLNDRRLEVWVTEQTETGPAAFRYELTSYGETGWHICRIFDADGTTLWGIGMNGVVFPQGAVTGPRPTANPADPRTTEAAAIIQAVSDQYILCCHIMDSGLFDGEGAPEPPADATNWPPTIEINGHGGYYRVYDSRYKTLEDIEQLLYRTYSKRRAGQLHEYTLGSPGGVPGLFAMHEGQLYRAMADGIYSPLSTEIVEIEVFNAEELRVTVNEYYDTNYYNLKRYRLVNEGGDWKIDYWEYLGD